eukprot:m.381641 g.381641  ORF g.381641 m.381641 type:complete len:184 (+) comp20044_c0_seq1:207-758(+)
MDDTASVYSADADALLASPFPLNSGKTSVASSDEDEVGADDHAGNISHARDLSFCSFHSAGDSDDEASPDETARHGYSAAVTVLQRLPAVFTAAEKLKALDDTFDAINQAIDKKWHGKERLQSLDEILPVFLAVLIQAKLPHLGAELQFLEDFSDRMSMSGESRFKLTTLRASYFQLISEFRT